MYKQMLKNQRVTFVANVNQAEEKSPFYFWLNERSGKYVVSHKDNGTVAAGLDRDEAEACVMFKANEFIFRAIQK